MPQRLQVIPLDVLERSVRNAKRRSQQKARVPQNTTGSSDWQPTPRRKAVPLIQPVVALCFLQVLLQQQAAPVAKPRRTAAAKKPAVQPLPIVSLAPPRWTNTHGGGRYWPPGIGPPLVGPPAYLRPPRTGQRNDGIGSTRGGLSRLYGGSDGLAAILIFLLPQAVLAFLIATLFVIVPVSFPAVPVPALLLGAGFLLTLYLFLAFAHWAVATQDNIPVVPLIGLYLSYLLIAFLFCKVLVLILA
jgi:hypothetical protein